MSITQQVGVFQQPPSKMQGNIKVDRWLLGLGRLHMAKSEIRISKSETNPNDQNPKFKTGTTLARSHGRVHSFEPWSIAILNLFRISDFVLRIFRARKIQARWQLSGRNDFLLQQNGPGRDS